MRVVRFPAAGRYGCCGRCGRKSRSAKRAPRRARWCAATGCGPALPPWPRYRCGPTLLNTSCAASDQPEVWLCVAGATSERGSFGLNSCIAWPKAGARRGELRYSMKKFMPIAQKNDRRGAKRSTSRPALMPARTYRRRRQRIGELEVLRSRRPPACDSRRSRSN